MAGLVKYWMVKAFNKIVCKHKQRTFFWNKQFYEVPCFMSKSNFLFPNVLASQPYDILNEIIL